MDDTGQFSLHPSHLSILPLLPLSSAFLPLLPPTFPLPPPDNDGLLLLSCCRMRTACMWCKSCALAATCAAWWR